MLAVFIYGAILLIISTYEDIKKREVYDFLNGLSILTPIVYAILLFFNKKEEFNIIYFAISMLFSFLIGSLLYYSGMWGGGDAKYIIAIGGYSYFISQLIRLPIQIEIYKPLIITTVYLLLSFIFGGVIAILILLFHFCKNYKKIIINKPYKITMVIVLTSIIISAIFSFRIAILLAILLLMIFMLAISREIEKTSFISMKDVDKLVPGDWIVEDIKLNSKVIRAKECKTGLTEEQIQEIKKAGIKKIKVKDGIPFFIGFLPAFLLFFIFLL